MNNKGLAISGILYTILLIFIVAIAMMLFNLQNRKTILDELKADSVDAVESDNNFEYLLNEINTLKETKTSIDKVYPIGSIYMSTSNTNPGTLFPGTTWVVWGAGRVPVGVDTSQAEFNSVEKTGGEKTHKLTTAEMPSHNHIVRVTWGDGNGNIKFAGSTSDTAQSFKVDKEGTTMTNGGSGAHNNLQPYITTYMWKRTS